jgi:hypothetical protein
MKTKIIHQWVVHKYHGTDEEFVVMTHRFYPNEKELREKDPYVTSEDLVYRAKWTEIEVRA